MSNSSSDSSKPYYGPQESAADILVERTVFIGNILSDILYGITLVLFFQCMHTLVQRRRTDTGMKSWFLMAYVLIMIVLGTLCAAMNIHMQEISYIDNRNFPGGPAAYRFLLFSNWQAIIDSICVILANWLADGLLMFRCYVVYNRHRLVLPIPILMYCGSLAMGIVALVQSMSASFQKVGIDFILPYFTISVALNITLTTLMIVRLLLHNRKMRSIGSTASGAIYTNIVAILVESCALYAVTSLFYIGPYAAGHPASQVIWPVLPQVQIIATYLIILRVARRTAVSGTYSTSPSSRGTTSFQVQAFRGSVSAGTGGTELTVRSKISEGHGAYSDVLGSPKVRHSSIHAV